MLSEIIILNNKKCQFVSSDDKLFSKLRNFLSYKLTGVEFTPAYQNGWNGITYLLDKSGKFDLGLLPKVEVFFKKRKIEYKITDNRLPLQINEPLDISNNLKKYNLIPREHQVRILNAAMANQKGIVRAATGSGKTLTTGMITAHLNKSTIIYVIGLDLLGQFHNLFSKIFDEKIGYIGNGICDPQRITIASIWTVGKALKLDDKKILNSEEEAEDEIDNESNHKKISDCLSKAKVHIFDESHVCSTSTISEIYKNIDPEHIYGFSGTPFREDNSDLQMNAVLGEKIIDISASEMIEKGIIAQPVIKFITIPKMSDVGSQYLSVYKNYIVENEIRNNLIIESTQWLLKKGYTPLVLFKQIKHGDILYKKMLDAGINCLLLSGHDSLEDRDKAKEKITNKEVDVLLASTIFDIGLDVPQLSGLVLCGGGQSLVKCLQRVGRSCRMIPGKKFAAVIDFYDQAKFLKKHSLKRLEVYSSEPGFKIIKSKEMK